MLTFLYWMCWRNEKLARKNIKEFIHNIHKQSHPANERVIVWVSEWKKKSWRNNVNCRALYFKLRPVRETLSFTNSFPSSWVKNLDTIKGEFQSEQESNFSLHQKKIYILNDQNVCVFFFHHLVFIIEFTWKEEKSDSAPNQSHYVNGFQSNRNSIR